MRKLDSKKREMICHIAKELFQKKGLRKTSMSEVAKGSGVAVGTLYLYFANKDELVRACVEEFLSKHYRAIEAAKDTTHSPSHRLLKYLKNRFEQAKSTRSDSHSAELTRHIMKLYPNRRREEAAMIVETVGFLLVAGKKAGEFPRLKDPEEVKFVFCHSIAWFFPIAGDSFREEPRFRDLERVVKWFISQWKEG